MPNQELSPLVLTIGHSTRAIDEFNRLLRVHGATCVVDVRKVPRSAHNPQFNKDSLARYLKKFGLKYVHMPGLGGLRHARRDSPNGGWRKWLLSRLCGLHANARVCGEPRRSDPNG
jgi:hypothetical protein